MINTVEEIVRYIIYAIILLITWLLISPTIHPLLQQRQTNRRYRGVQKENEQKPKRNKFVIHLERIIRISLNTRSKTAIYTFFLISGILFFFALLFCIRSEQTIFFSILTCAAAGSTPYLILFVRLRSIHVTSSYEADTLVTELISQYKLNFLNMLEAIDQTIIRLRKDMYTRKSLFRLSLDMKESRSKEEIEEITNEFAYSLGTEWGKLLANNIYQAVANRDDVREGLEDILNELLALKSVNEANKQYNSESFIIIKIVAPAAYLFSVYGAIKWLGFSPQKFIEYQLKNPQGLQYFVYTMCSIALNYFVYFFIRRPKNDF